MKGSAEISVHSPQGHSLFPALAELQLQPQCPDTTSTSSGTDSHNGAATTTQVSLENTPGPQTLSSFQSSTIPTSPG